jgi:hypothetical protein
MTQINSCESLQYQLQSPRHVIGTNKMIIQDMWLSTSVQRAPFLRTLLQDSTLREERSRSHASPWNPSTPASSPGRGSTHNKLHSTLHGYDYALGGKARVSTDAVELRESVIPFQLSGLVYSGHYQRKSNCWCWQLATLPSMLSCT